MPKPVERTGTPVIEYIRQDGSITPNTDVQVPPNPVIGERGGLKISFSQKDIIKLQNIAAINTKVLFKKNSNIILVGNPQIGDLDKDSVIVHTSLYLNDTETVFPFNFVVQNLSGFLMAFKSFDDGPSVRFVHNYNAPSFLKMVPEGDGDDQGTQILGTVYESVPEDFLPALPDMPDIDESIYSDIEFKMKSKDNGKKSREIHRCIMSSGKDSFSIKCEDRMSITIQSESSKKEPTDGPQGAQNNVSLVFGGGSTTSTSRTLSPTYLTDVGPKFNTGKLKLSLFKMLYNMQLDEEPDNKFGNFNVSIDVATKWMRFRDVEEYIEFFIKMNDLTAEEPYPPYDDWGGLED